MLLRSRRRRLLFIISVAASVLGVGCTDDTRWQRDGVGVAPPGTAALAALERVVDDSVRDDDVPGVLVGVRWVDGTEWVHAAGVADLATGEPIRAELQWPARSITKSFTVTALLDLVDAGVLGLDDPVGRYVEGVPGGGAPTLEQLADMTSGLPDYTNERFVEAFSEDPTRVFDEAELLGFVSGVPPDAEPGAEHRYVNTNTLLLGMAMAEATGATVTQLLDELTAGFGLEDTWYRPDPARLTTATGYQPDGDGLAAVPLTFGVFGAAGAMSTNLSDLLTWGRALVEGADLDPMLAARRFEVAAPLSAGPEYDAYGLGVGELDGWWGHTGEGLGYTALVMHDPSSGTTVAVFSNVSNLASQHVPTALFGRLAPLLSGDA